MKRVTLRALTLGAIAAAGIQGCSSGQADQPPTPEHRRSVQDLTQTGTPSVTSDDILWERLDQPLLALDGTRHSPAEWRGRIVLINFWASWCAPCQYEIPELTAIQTLHADAGLQVLGVGIDRMRPLRNVARSLGINYPVLVADDATGRRLLKRLGNPDGTIPYSAVIDRMGTLAYTHLGQMDQEVFAEYIAPLLRRP